MTTPELTADDADTITHPLPRSLESSNSKLVYFYLQIEGDATIDELERALGLKKVTLYSLLRTLTAAGLVEQSGPTYVCRERTGGASER